MTDSSSQVQAADSLGGTGFPFSGSPQLAKTSETVINPEGKPPASEGDSSPFTVRPDSEIQRLLFPDLSLVEAGELPPSPSGLKLAHFEIVDRIGSGGMGSVFLARDLHLQRYVALKILAPTQAREPNAVQRFLNEARAAARLDYDGIARVHYYGEDRGYHFIAFEYVTGTNVRDLIFHSGPLSPADAINFTLQVAHALKHTSAAGVVHRDIKPSNIIVNPSGRAKLVDLGLARKESSGSMEDLTVAGTTLGTFDYISPEQAQDPRNVDVRSDIYSLGCTLYHMLTGEPPYPEGTLAQKLLDHQQSYVPNPADRNRRVPVQLAAVTQKMMAADPKKRYQSPESLIRDLLAVANDQGLRGVTPEGLVWSGGVSQPRHQFLIKYGSWLAAVAALLLIVFAIDWIDRLPPEQASTAPPAKGQGPLAANDARSEIDSGSSNSNDSLDEQEHSANSSEKLIPPSPISEFPQNSQAMIGNDDSEAVESGPGETPRNQYELELESPTESNPLPRMLSLDLLPHDNAVARQQSQLWKGPPFPWEAGSPSIEDNSSEKILSAPPPGSAVGAETFPPKGIPAGPVALLVGGSTKEYATLEAACVNARSGSIIELRYDGALPNQAEKPITIDKKLTIKAATGYRPIVEFTTRKNPDASDTRMITIRKGSLNLVGVDLRLRVKDGVSYTARDAWTMFSLQGSDQLNLKNVTVTMDNPQRKPAVMFEMVRPPGGDPEMSDMKPGVSATVDPFNLTIGDSVLRGECDAFVIKTIDPGQIRIEQSVIAADNSLFVNLGANDTVDEFQELNVSLNHATVITGASPFRFDTGSDSPRSLLHTSLSCENSLFVLSPIYVAPFMSMSGDTIAADLRDAVTWHGLRNFYHGFVIFRTISDSRGTSELADLDFDGWTQFWDQNESKTSSDEVEWSTPWDDASFSSLTPDQLQFEMDTEKQQVMLATDGTIVGADLTQVPRPPGRVNPLPTGQIE